MPHKSLPRIGFAALCLQRFYFDGAFSRLLSPGSASSSSLASLQTFVFFLVFSLLLYVVFGGTGSDPLLLLDDEGEEDKDDGGRDANGDSHCDSPVLLL